MKAYISNQVKMHSYHLNFEILDNEFCKFHKRKFWRKWKANLKWRKIEIACENFSFLIIFQPRQAACEN